MKKKESFLLRFAKRSSLLEAGLLKGMADIHSHYLPGVDDGFQTEADAVETLLQMQEWGVTRVYCTPHMMTDYSENRPDFLRERFARFVEVVPDGLAMRLAGEYMLDAGFAAQRKAGLLTLGKDFVLIEMSYMSPSPGLMNTLYELQLNGLKPILAHPERYLFMDEKRYRELKEKGCRFQLNLMSLAGQYGPWAKDVSWFLLQNGLYDFVGTDIHHLKMFRYNMSRLMLTTKEQDLLRNLMRQNNLLW